MLIGCTLDLLALVRNVPLKRKLERLELGDVWVDILCLQTLVTGIGCSSGITLLLCLET